MQEPRRKREIDIQATKKRYTNDKALTPSTSYVDQSNPGSGKTAANLTSRDHFVNVTYNTSFIMDGLQHFAKYTISVKACREQEDANDTGESCSTQSIVTLRTLKKGNVGTGGAREILMRLLAEGVDYISKVTVTQHNSNSSNLDVVRLTWDEPPNPNGIILTYSVEYTRVEADRNVRIVIKSM